MPLLYWVLNTFSIFILENLSVEIRRDAFLFTLRQIEHFLGGEGACCRLSIGMQKLPQDVLYQSLALRKHDGGIDNSIVIRHKKQIIQAFCEQLTWGTPTNQDEAALQRLKEQIEQKKVIIKLFLISVKTTIDRLYQIYPCI